MHDALKRRCLYQWIDYPDFDTELQIVQLKIPDLAPRLSRQIVTAVQRLRDAELFKAPGVAETLDWGRALQAMDRDELDEEAMNDTLGVLLKYQDDVQRVQGAMVSNMVKEAHAGS